jgi:hypothetical protein
MKHFLSVVLVSLVGLFVPRDIPLMAQTAGALTESDLTQISGVVSQYIRSNYPGRLGFDVITTCKNGRPCEEPQRDEDKAAFQNNKLLFNKIKAGAGAVTMPLKSASTCTKPNQRTCRLRVDYYFQLFEPTISDNSTRLGMWVSEDSPGLKAGEYYMATTTVTLDLTKVNGQWRVTGTKTHPTS